MTVIGVDVGLGGAIAIIDDRGLAKVHDMPIVGNEVDGKELRRILDIYGDREMVFVEQAQAMPRQGASSGFHYGVSFGKVLGVLESLDLRYEKVPPSVWKSHWNIKAMPPRRKLYGKAKDRYRQKQKAKAKEQARAKAMHFFPKVDLSQKQHHGRAESLLIALFGLAWLRDGH